MNFLYISTHLFCILLNIFYYQFLYMTSDEHKGIIIFENQEPTYWASLVAQWLRICLPVQGTWVQALVWEDPTCHGATRPVSHKLLSLHVWSLCSATREAAIVKGPRTAMKSGPCSPQLEKALAQKRRPNTAKNK